MICLLTTGIVRSVEAKDFIRNSADVHAQRYVQRYVYTAETQVVITSDVEQCGATAFPC